MEDFHQLESKYGQKNKKINIIIKNKPLEDTLLICYGNSFMEDSGLWGYLHSENKLKITPVNTKYTTRMQRLYILKVSLSEGEYYDSDDGLIYFDNNKSTMLGKVAFRVFESERPPRIIFDYTTCTFEFKY